MVRTLHRSIVVYILNIYFIVMYKYPVNNSNNIKIKINYTLRI